LRLLLVHRNYLFLLLRRLFQVEKCMVLTEANF
jgi:hypothetical protein